MRIPKFSGLSLRTQIALVFGILVVVVTASLSLALGEMLKHQIQRRAAESLHVVARNTAKMMADGLFDRSREVQVTAEARALWEHGLDSPEARQALARIHAVQPHNAWIGVADLQGKVRSAADDVLLGQDVGERPWFMAGQKGLFVGDVHPAKLLAKVLPASVTGEPLRFVDFSAPIVVDGQLKGVLGMHGGWDWAHQVAEAMLPVNAREQQQTAFIFDRTGKVIYAPPGEVDKLNAAGQQMPFQPSRSERLGAADLATAVPWQDGQRYLTAVVRMEARSLASDLGWYVVVRQPEDKAFRDANLAVAKAAGIGVLMALLATGLALVAARRLSGDLRAITAAVRQLEVDTGKGADIPVYDSSREVQALSSALQSTTRHLLRANEEMDMQVKDRTRELEVANRELDLLARSDPLTGLLNRRGFGAHLKAAMPLALRSGRPLSVIMLDVDHFKRINDSFGHDVGDEVLKYLGHMLPGRLRGSDVVGRLGGEEFVVMLPDTGPEGALAIATALNQEIAAHSDPVYGSITISAGVATTAPGMSDAAVLLRHADEALYQAKGSGRNRVCVAAVE